MNFLLSREFYLRKKKLLGTAVETGLDALKTAFRKVIHKAAETLAELIGNNMVNKIVKPNSLPAENLRDDEKIIVAPEKRRTY